MKTNLGILAGIVAFFTVLALVGALFKKSPETIAKEECAKMRNNAEALIPGQTPSISIEVKGTIFKCN